MRFLERRAARFKMHGSALERFNMTAPRRKRSLAAILIARDLTQALAKRRESIASLRRKIDRVIVEPPGGLARQVDLVAHDRYRNTGGQFLVNLMILPVGRVLYQQDGIGTSERLVCAANALLLDPVRIFPQSGSIYELDGEAVDINLFAQDVARRAGNFGYDCGLLSTEQVQQARLAGIRLADNHDLQSVTQQTALGCAFAQYGEGRRTLLDTSEQRLIGEKVDLLLRKVDRRFDVKAQFHELLRKRIDRCGEITRKRSQRRPRGLRSSCIDQIDDRLRLHEVELVIEESAFREFTRLRAACAIRDYGIDEHRHYERAAVAVQLENGLAGKRSRCRKVQCQAGINATPIATPKRAESCRSRFR